MRTHTDGDLEFADDTALIGWLDELSTADKLFVETLLDRDQQEHPGKREIKADTYAWWSLRNGCF